MFVEAERARSRAKRKPSKRSPRDENEEQDRRDSKQERKTSPSKDENAGEKDEKEEEKVDEAKDANSSGIKVKTLEEILREKALKKLEERRAQGKIQRDAEEGKVDENGSEGDKGTEKADEEVSCIIESEKPSVTVDTKDNGSIDSSTEKSTATRKVSTSDNKSPVKKVIKTKKILINKDNNNVESSTEKTIATKRISANAEDDQGGEGKVTSNEPPSPFQEVRVKSFEEIMQEKRKRKAEEGSSRGSSEDVSEEAKADVPGEANSSTAAMSSIPPKRLKRIVRKSSGDSDKEAKVVSSSGAEDTASKVKPARKRTVYVMEKASPSKENGVYSAMFPLLKLTMGIIRMTPSLFLLENTMQTLNVVATLYSMCW